MSGSVGEALQEQIGRVRDDVLPVYVKIGAPGLFASASIRHDLDLAVKALAEGDAVACIRMLERLKGWNL